MPNEARKIATLADFMSLDPQAKAELIDGQIVYKMQPSGWHSRVSTCISSRVCSVFDRKPKGDGTGGWWVLSEVTVQYRKLERILQPDIAGWRRERTPVCPKEYPVQERPDWVCEVCVSTRKKDTTIVPETLAAEGVPYYWFVDAENDHLQVFELNSGKYSLIQSLFRDDGKVKIKPFDAIEFHMGEFFGDDPE